MARGSGRKRAAANGHDTGAAEDVAASAAPTAETPKRGRGRPPKVREDLPNGPTPDQRAETLASLIRLDTEKARISQEIATVLNRFEKWGGKKRQIKETKRLLMLDKREAAAEVETLLRYLRDTEIQISWEPSGQSSLVDALASPAQPQKKTEGDRDLSVARAHSDGFNSGRAGGVPSDNPYRHAPGSEEYVAWHDGRDEGQQAREAKSGLKDRLAEEGTPPAEQAASSDTPPPF